MKLHKLSIVAVLSLMCLATHAQQVDPSPKKGDFTLAATVGYNSYTSLQALPGNQNDYSLQAVPTNWNDKMLTIGLEAGWFCSDWWKLSVGGGLSITSNPGYTAIPGSAAGDAETADGAVPNYSAVASQSDIQFNVFVGADRYFKTGIQGLMPYAGLRAGYAYGRNSAYADDENWMGKSIGESFNVRGALTCGVDYFLAKGIFVGVQVDPFAYTYNKSTVKPQAGLRNLEANSHNFSVLAAPTVKVGFKF